jgi:hypothetical protein
MERIIRRESGILRKRLTLKLELPATVIGDNWHGWVAQSFADVELEELANVLGLRSIEMIAAAAQDRQLSAAVTIMAFRQGNASMARQAYEAMPEVLPWLTWPLLQSIEDVEPNSRKELAEYLVRKYLDAGSITSAALGQVHRLLTGPISDGLIDGIMRAPVWSQWSAHQGNHFSLFAPVAALCSSAKRPALREALAKIDSAHIMPILQFLDMLDSLEKVNPRE